MRWRRLAGLPPLLAAALLASCQDRLAGSSTMVGNSLERVAVLSDGSPAEGALVAIRSGDVVFQGGRPQSPVVAATIADGRGHFRLPAADKGFYLQISGCSKDSCRAADYPQVYFRHFADTALAGD